MRVGKTIYLDHQATTPVDPRVFEKMKPFFCDFFGNPHSVEHVMGWEANKVVEDCCGVIGSLVGGGSSEIIFTSGATEANNLAIRGISLGKKRVGKSKIIISSIEHKSIIESARNLQLQHGFEVSVLPVSCNGITDIDALERELGEHVAIVSIMSINNEIGSIQPLRQISDLCKQHGIVFHTDATQAPTGMNVTDLGEIADLISLSGHKMYGPKGIGVLYVSNIFQKDVTPILCGGYQQNGIRPGTVPVPLCVGMAAAAELIMAESAIERELLRIKRDAFLEKLVQAIPVNVVVNGPDATDRHPGNANVRIEGINAQDLLLCLQPSVAASTGSACTSGILEASHVLKAIGLSEDACNSSIRFSLGRFTSEADIDEAVRIIRSAYDQVV